MDYMDNLLMRYSRGNVVLEETQDSGIYILHLKLDRVEIIIFVDATGLPDKCPAVRIDTPVFEFSPNYPVRMSGLIVIDGLTQRTWKGGDFVQLLVSKLTKSVPKFYVGEYYNGDVAHDDLMSIEEDYNQRDAKIVDIKIKNSLVGNTIEGNIDSKYVILQNRLGVKTACNVVRTNSNTVMVSPNVYLNLFGSNRVEVISIEPVVVTSLSLCGRDEGSVKTTDSLNDYAIVMYGDRILLNGATFFVDHLKPHLAVLMVTSKPTIIKINYNSYSH